MKNKIVLLVLMSLFSITSHGKGLPKVKAQKVNLDASHLVYIDSVVDESIKDSSVVGAVVAVVRHGKIAYLKAYGNKEVYPTIIPMTENTVFDLASLTKPIVTATATFLLIERGQLRLSDRVSHYIPAYKAWTDTTSGKQDPIKIINLLTHTSGLPPYAPVSQLKDDSTSSKPDVLINYICEVDREAEPQTHMTYSCLNFVSLQRIIEQITGKNLRDFAQDNIFKPLGMNHTDYNPTGETLAWTAPTEMQVDGTVLLGTVHDPLARIMNQGISGNAGLFSNAEDLAVFATMLMNGGIYKHSRILGPMTVKAMTTVPRGYELFGRGLGWDVYSPYSSNEGDLLSPSTFGHTGYTGTSLVIDPETQTAIIVLTNRVHPIDKGSVSKLRAKIANVVAGSILK